jgi:uncharacterized protein
MPNAATLPDYAGLIRFLMQPFLDNPEALRIDCEAGAGGARVLIRLAFEGTDKGRAFGRGGRNINAVRTVLIGVAKAAGQSASLEIYGGQPQDEQSEDRGRSRGGGDRPRERSAPPRPKPRP